jgi:AraC family cel operon transcriptional repressor
MRDNEARIIYYSDLPVDGLAAHVARTLYESGESVSRHTHDFAEAFWVTSGSGYQVLNDERLSLKEGDAQIIHPTDVHSLGARLGESMAIVNVAFPASHLAELDSRLDENRDPAADPVRGARLSQADFAEVETALARFATAADSRLRLEILLLTLVDRIASAHADRRPSRADRPPAWLAAAARDLARSPSLLQEGISALIRRTGKSADHVGRVCRRTEGVTAAGLVNRIRLDRAATLLVGPDRSVTEIAFESGFSNLSYFYRRFRERFGTSPRRYREAAHSTIRG